MTSEHLEYSHMDSVYTYRFISLSLYDLDLKKKKKKKTILPNSLYGKSSLKSNDFLIDISCGSEQHEGK